MRRFFLGIAACLGLLLAAETSQAQYYYYSPGTAVGVYTPVVTVNYAQPYYYGPYYRSWYARPYVTYYGEPYYRYRSRWYGYPYYGAYSPGTVYYYPGPVYYSWY
jgi:hypothetical protein